MIELKNNVLNFRFPDVHAKARCEIDFQRTLRIPDDNRDYPLPPGLGRFPLQHVDDHIKHLPETWRKHGGIFLPMYQAEALWLHFSGGYPCAIKIAAGKINAVTGDTWSNALSADPQDYVVSPDQPWLDGFNVSKGYIRQFVAMPLGEGYTAEEQITNVAEHGGLQIIVYPMKRDAYAKYMDQSLLLSSDISACYSCSELEMGLAPGGLMRQEIYKDEYGIDVWDQTQGARCFVHITNSERYLAITGQHPPHNPPTAKEYTQAGLPWFEYYSDGNAIPGAKLLGKMTSVAAKVVGKGHALLEDNDPLQPEVVKVLNKKDVVREGDF